jgi:uncharacterized protein YjiS (DUF1127 family)
MIISSLINSLVSQISAYFSYRRTYQALSALGDRELADLGIGRGRIEDVARSAAR